MHDEDPPIPKVEKISRLIDALRDHAVKEGRAFPGDAYCAPRLEIWDAVTWFELVQDWEVADFLTCGSRKATKLLRTMRLLMQWYGQAERNDIIRRMSILN